MKLLSLLVMLLAFRSYAQTPVMAVRRDSLPSVFPPDVYSPGRSAGAVDSPDLMPNARPNNSFYRYHLDPPNVVRATLDNMPVKVPDSSTRYTMLRSYQKYWKPDVPPMQFLRPMPQIVPKKRY